MSSHVIVVGAGIIGASIAWHLARAGHRVSVLDQALPAGAASGRSFGWLNASFYASADHHRLRVASMQATREMALAIKTDAVRWSGCLDFEIAPDGLEKRAAELRDLGYPLKALDRAEVARQYPFLKSTPEAALFYPQEGAADLSLLTHDLLSASAAQGATIQTGLRVERLLTRGGTVVGVSTSAGDLEGDLVVIAAGTGAPGLLAPLGVNLPLLPRPGVIFSTQPVSALTDVVMVSPQMEIRQNAAGRFIAPCVAGHQGDSASEIDRPPADAAREALVELNAMINGPDLALAQATVGWRPVPQDGLPVIGPAGPEGLYVAVMHSGATLAAIAGQYAAAEIAGQNVSELSPYRIERFAQA